MQKINVFQRRGGPNRTSLWTVIIITTITNDIIGCDYKGVYGIGRWANIHSSRYMQWDCFEQLNALTFCSECQTSIIYHHSSIISVYTISLLLWRHYLPYIGDSGAKQPEDTSHSIQSLMLQCTQVAISYPTVFPQTDMQMDLQTSSGHDANSVTCVDANMLDHTCSSSEPSLLHSTSESPPLIELEDSDGGQASVQQQWSYEEQFRQVNHCRTSCTH